MASETLFAAGSGGEIYTLAFNAPSRSLSVTSSTPAGSAPTWIELHPSLPVLYAVDEFHPKDGRISAFRIGDDGKLQSLGPSASSGGEGPVHLVFKGEGSLYVADYAGATVSRRVVAKDGTFATPEKAEQQFQLSGKGPHTERQEAPHPHGVFLDPTGSFLLCADLGTDLLRIFSIDEATSSLTELDAIPMPAGSGPRHLRFHRTSSGKILLYLVNELANNLAIYSVEYPSSQKLSLSLLQTTSVLPSSQAPHEGDWTAAELEILPSGRHILVSNRSPKPALEGPIDQLVLLTIDEEGLVQGEGREIDSGGRGLRHFEVSPDGKWVAVGCEKTNEVVMFAIEEGDELEEVARVKGTKEVTVVRWRK